MRREALKLVSVEDRAGFQERDCALVAIVLYLVEGGGVLDRL
jgi:hypothetical protein